MMVIVDQQFILQVIEKAVEVGADSSQYPNNWIFHAREKKPGKAFVDGLTPDPYVINLRPYFELIILHVCIAIVYVYSNTHIHK